MSVALMIDNPRNKAEERVYVPVAAEQAFEQFWQEAAKQLKLEWVPLFQFGLVFDYERKEVVIQELERVKVWFLKNVGDKERAEWLIERVMTVIHAIQEILKDRKLRIFIG